MAGKKSPTWKFVKRWSPETKRAFEVHLATLLDAVDHPRAAEKRTAAGLVLNALPKRDREALAKRWPDLVGAFRSIAEAR